MSITTNSIKTRLTESVKMRQYLSPVLLRCWAVASFLLSCQAAGLLSCCCSFLFGELLTCWVIMLLSCWAVKLQSCWATKLTISRKGLPWCQEGISWCQEGLPYVPYASEYISYRAAWHATPGMRRYAITKALDKLLDTQIFPVRLVLATSSPRGCSSWLEELWLQVGYYLNNNINKPYLYIYLHFCTTVFRPDPM